MGIGVGEIDNAILEKLMKDMIDGIAMRYF